MGVRTQGQRGKENEKEGCGTRWGGADFGWVVSSHFFLMDCDPSVNALAGQKKNALGGKKKKRKGKKKLRQGIIPTENGKKRLVRHHLFSFLLAGSSLPLRKDVLEPILEARVSNRPHRS